MAEGASVSKRDLFLGDARWPCSLRLMELFLLPPSTSPASWQRASGNAARLLLGGEGASRALCSSCVSLECVDEGLRFADASVSVEAFVSDPSLCADAASAALFLASSPPIPGLYRHWDQPLVAAEYGHNEAVPVEDSACDERRCQGLSFERVVESQRSVGGWSEEGSDSGSLLREGPVDKGGRKKGSAAPRRGARFCYEKIAPPKAVRLRLLKLGHMLLQQPPPLGSGLSLGAQKKLLRHWRWLSVGAGAVEEVSGESFIQESPAETALWAGANANVLAASRVCAVLLRSLAPGAALPADFFRVLLHLHDRTHSACLALLALRRRRRAVFGRRRLRLAAETEAVSSLAPEEAAREEGALRLRWESESLKAQTSLSQAFGKLLMEAAASTPPLVRLQRCAVSV